MRGRGLERGFGLWRGLIFFIFFFCTTVVKTNENLRHLRFYFHFCISFYHSVRNAVFIFQFTLDAFMVMPSALLHGSIIFAGKMVQPSRNIIIRFSFICIPHLINTQEMPRIQSFQENEKFTNIQHLSGIFGVQMQLIIIMTEWKIKDNPVCTELSFWFLKLSHYDDEGFQTNKQ